MDWSTIIPRAIIIAAKDIELISAFTNFIITNVIANEIGILNAIRKEDRKSRKIIRIITTKTKPIYAFDCTTSNLFLTIRVSSLTAESLMFCGIVFVCLLSKV